MMKIVLQFKKIIAVKIGIAGVQDFVKMELVKEIIIVLKSNKNGNKNLKQSYKKKELQ